MDTDQQRARSFGGVAEAYQRARPTYPPHAVSWVLDAAPGREVLDLAAGTGKLTQPLLAAGSRPSPLRRDRAPRLPQPGAVRRRAAGNVGLVDQPDRDDAARAAPARAGDGAVVRDAAAGAGRRRPLHHAVRNGHAPRPR